MNEKLPEKRPEPFPPVSKRDLVMQDLAFVINRHSLEAECGDTPDFIIAEYLLNCLDAFSKAMSAKHNYENK